MDAMKQMSLSESGYERKTKRTRKREFLDDMNRVVPYAELVLYDTPMFREFSGLDMGEDNLPDESTIL